MRSLLISIKAILVFTLITGVLYPMFILGIAQVFFPVRANGSLMYREGKITGSKLIIIIFTRSESSATSPGGE